MHRSGSFWRAGSDGLGTRMLWIFATVCMGLLVVLLQLLMAYHRRAYELRMKQEPLRRRIRVHKQAMQEAVAKIHQAADLRLEELDGEMAEFSREVTQSEKSLAELKDEVSGEEEEEEEEKAEEEEEGGDGKVEVGSLKEPNLRGMVRQATQIQEELSGHLSGLQRDLELVRRTLNRIDSKLQRTGARLPPAAAAKRPAANAG